MADRVSGRVAHRPLVIGVPLLVVVVAFAVLFARSGGGIFGERPPAVAPPLPPVPVVVAHVQEQDVPIVLEGLGTVQALNTATIRSQITGMLESVDFVEGQDVRAGDVLAQIDPRPFQAQLDEANAQLARDKDNLANLQVNLGRNLPLLGHGFVTDQEVADQRARIAELQDTIQSDAAAIVNAQTQLSYATLRAPFNGVTGIRLLDIGNIMHPNDATGLVVVTQVQPISVVFILPARDIPQVQAALAKAPVAVVAYDQSGARALDTGRLLLINNQADPRTGTIQLKANFPNAQRHLWPGTFVNAATILETVKDGLVIPANALQQGSNGLNVYVVGPDNRVSLRIVEVGQRRKGMVLVSSGLHAGETVVVQGQYRLVPGTLVRAAPPEDVVNVTPASSGMLP